MSADRPKPQNNKIMIIRIQKNTESTPVLVYHQEVACSASLFAAITEKTSEVKAGTTYELSVSFNGRTFQFPTDDTLNVKEIALLVNGVKSRKSRSATPEAQATA